MSRTRQHQWQPRGATYSNDAGFRCSVCGAECQVSVAWSYSSHWREWIFQAYPPHMTYCPPGATPDTCIEPERSA